MAGRSSNIGGHYVANSQDDPGYIASLEKIQEAHTRIWIIGDYSPFWMPLDVPARRNDYLLTIEQHVVKQVAGGNGDFQYIRIIQRDPALLERIKHHAKSDEDEYALYEEVMVGDEQVFQHCLRVQDGCETSPTPETSLTSQASSTPRGNANVSIYVSSPLPNCPSMLLIDNHYVLFTMPSKHKMHLNEDDGSYLLNHITHGVLVLEDRSKDGNTLVKHFEDIFNTALNESLRVKAVHP